MRLVQYGSRCMSGITGNVVFANLLYALAVSRKTLRFGRQLKYWKDICDWWCKQCDSFDRITTIAELGSYFVYCFVDHMCFAQRIGLLRLDPKKSDKLDRFAEFWWLTEVVPVIARESRALKTGGGEQQGSKAWHERRRKAFLLLLKSACDLPCSIYFLQVAQWRNRPRNKAWCGLLGVIASIVSLHMNWPRHKCLED